MITDQDYYAISDNAHFLGGCLAVYIGTEWFGHYGCWIGSGLVIAGAAFKEFYWDPRHETPEEAGPSGWRDFFGYALGVGVGLTLIWAKLRYLS